jgi:hypothetical protein
VLDLRTKVKGVYYYYYYYYYYYTKAEKMNEKNVLKGGNSFCWGRRPLGQYRDSIVVATFIQYTQLHQFFASLFTDGATFLLISGYRPKWSNLSLTADQSCNVQPVIFNVLCMVLQQRKFLLKHFYVGILMIFFLFMGKKPEQLEELH